jgi:predicted RNase H-like nuclease
MAGANWIAGVDGCPAGWIVALAPADDITAPRIRVIRRLAQVLEAPEAPTIIAVDMPIGLPERIEGNGRAPERLVRPLLGARQSSVFSIPARAAIYAADYVSACAEAAARSEPPRKVSKQGFMLFPRIREIDTLLLENESARAMLFESHPEVVFWALNAGRALGQPKKIKGSPWPDGMALRAEAPLSSPPTRELSTPMPARQLAPVVVSLALGRGDEALTIALDPVELGRVEVSIGQGKEAGQLRIVAERPETLALLQRDQRELDRALNQAGLGDLARSLSFSLASDQGRQQQTGAEERGQRRASFTLGGVEGEGAMPGLPAPLRNATSLIDIAV